MQLGRLDDGVGDLFAMSMTFLIVSALLPALLAGAALSDVATMTIPNRLCLAIAVLFAPAAFLAGFDLGLAAMHMLAGFLVLAVCFGCFAAGWIGGGDAKLAAAIGVWVGFDQMLPFLLVASVAGGALTLLFLFMRNVPLPAVAEQQAWVRRLHAADQGVPYGVALAAGAAHVLPLTAIWRMSVGG